MKLELAQADANLASRDHIAEVQELSAELSRLLPKLLRSALRSAKWRILLTRMAAPHSIAAARMLTRNLREHGKTQLMMYGRPSANYQFPSSMWLLPGGLNGWFAARDFQGLNQERIECSHQMVLVSCDEGQSNRTLYTIYPARDDFPLKWQIHWSYTFETHSRTYDMGNLFPACFAQVCTKLEPLLTRHQNLVVAQQETLRRTDRRQSAAFSGL